MTATAHGQPLHRLCALRLALLIALFAALAPTVSHALVWLSGNPSNLVEVCTNTGPRWMALVYDQGDHSQELEALPFGIEAPDPAEKASIFEHCPFCLHTADQIALPCRAPTHFLASLIEQAKLQVWQTSVVSTPFLLRPPPRGPPGSL